MYRAFHTARPATGQPDDAGVSLVEVIVAVFIVGLAAGAIVTALPQRDGPVASDAKKLFTVMEDARNEARLRGVPVELRLSDEGYRLVRWSPVGWQSVDVGRERFVDFACDCQLSLERRAEWDAGDRVFTRPDGTVEDVIRFEPTGLLAPVILALRDGERDALIEVDEAGAMTLETAGR